MNHQYDRAADVFFDGPLPDSLVADLVGIGDGSTEVGAQALFLGRVRADLHDGRPVTGLEYESYRAMALPVLERVLSETAAAHNLSALQVRHSLGQVSVGQLCFAVVAAASHRAAALDGCSVAVERIKKEVPIFAKEFLEGGDYVWKRNS